MKPAGPLRVMVAALPAVWAACSTSPGGGLVPPPTGVPGPEQVRIRVLNNTPYGLNPQLFVTASENGLELFDAGNQVRNFGVAGTGLLDAQSFEVFDFPCDQVRFLGSAGGIFHEIDSPAEVGRSGQLTAARDLIYSCGDTVTLTFSESDGSFVVNLRRE